MFKQLIFDFDGTIVDSRYMIVAMINRLAGKYKLRTIREQDYAHLRGLTVVERCRFVGLPLYKLPLFKLDLTRTYRETADELEPVPGLREVLEALKVSGVRLSIISSNSTENIKRFLARNGIDLFDGIHTSGNIFGKDRTIAGFLKRYRLRSEDVAYVGDECRDIEACRKNNVRVIAVTWGYDDRELLAANKPDYLVDSPSGLLELVNRGL